MIERVLIVGLGSIGRRHAGIIKKLLPDSEIIVLRHNQCDPRDVKLLGLCDCVTTVSNALMFKPQIAIIANPATKHLEVGIQLAKAGVHLLIEKPISNSSNRVQELIDICTKKNNLLMIAYNLRFLPSLIEFRKLIEREKVGKIFSIRAEVGQHLSSWRSDSDYRKTVSAQKKLGGGVLLELSHEIDYLSWIFGSINWVKSHVSKISNLDINVEDNASIIFGFDDKLNNDFVATLNLDFIRKDTTRECVVIGELGTLRWNGITGMIQFYSGKSDKWKLLFSSQPERDYTYTEQSKYFLSQVEDQVNSVDSGIDGLRVVQTIEAVHKANNTGKITYL